MDGPALGAVAPCARGTDFVKWTAPVVLSLLVLAGIAFWPRYLSSPITLGTPQIHFHATTATLWFLLLAIQPMLVANRRPEIHRALGYSSLALAPLVVLAFVLAAHSQLATRAEPGIWPLGQYILYLQLSLGAMFALIWALGMFYRKDRLVHARFMAATALTFVDPVLARLLPRIEGLNNNLVTAMVVDLILIALIWIERDARRGRWVFPVLLVLFILQQVPIVLRLTDAGVWNTFSRWYLGLPLS